MAKTNNPYAGLVLNRDLIGEAVQSAGGTSVDIQVAGTQRHICFDIEGKSYRMSAFFNNDGKTTLSKQAGYDEEVFAKVAESIKTICTLGPGGAFELSIPRFPAGDVEQLLEYLVSEGAEIKLDVVDVLGRRVRICGKQGDALNIKYHVNKTLQLQGKRAMLAAMTLDMLSSVLDYESSVKAQLDTFKVPLKIADVEDEFEGRWALAFSGCPPQVKAQLISAMALTKIDIELPDYSPVAFPALRGLEGFMKHKLDVAGLNVKVVDGFGEYFEKNPANHIDYQLRDPHRAFVGDPMAVEIAKCYTEYRKERHGIAHMGVSVVDTRMLPTLLAARDIVFKTLDTIEGYCRTMSS